MPGFGQLLIGRRYRVGVDFEAACERADARKSLSGSDVAPEDLQLELRDELIAHGAAAPSIEDDVHRPPFRLNRADYATLAAPWCKLNGGQATISEGLLLPFLTPRKRRLVLRILFYGGAVFILIPLALSQALVGGYRGPTNPPPVGYREIHFVSEGLRLRGWLKETGGRRAAVIVGHGLGDSLESYTEVASTLGERGHTVLLFDFRAHGGSEGRYTTLGARERLDVLAAAAFMRSSGLAPRGLILMGYSMGAVAVLRAASELDASGVIAEAPYDTYRENAVRHAQLLYHLPRWAPIIPITIAWAEWRAGFHASEVNTVDAARRIHAPLLLIADGEDNRMPEAVVRRILDAHPGPKRFWLAPAAGHCGAMLLPEYWPRVLGFLDENHL